MGNYGLVLPPNSYAVQKLDPVFGLASAYFPFNEKSAAAPAPDLYNPGTVAALTNPGYDANGPYGLGRRSGGGAGAAVVTLPGSFSESGWTALLTVGVKGLDGNTTLDLLTFVTGNPLMRFQLHLGYGNQVNLGLNVNNGDAASSPALIICPNGAPDLIVAGYRWVPTPGQTGIRTLSVCANAVAIGQGAGGADWISGPSGLWTTNFHQSPYLTAGQSIPSIDLMNAYGSGNNFYFGNFVYWPVGLTDAQFQAAVAAPSGAWPTALTAAAPSGVRRGRGL